MKTLKSHILITLGVLISINLSAQVPKGDGFKGTITYQITYPDANLDASQMAAMPQTMKLTLNGNKARAELKMSEMNQVLIMDSDAKTTVILVEINGQKAAIKPKQNDRPLSKEPILESANESKEIAGFVCKKANIHYGDEKSKASPIPVYYSEEVGNNKIFYDNEYRNVPGVPLEFKYKLQGMNMLLTAIKVEKGRVSSREFEIPSDYKETTPEEIRKMFGGGM
jgi:hypothetical protein